MTRYWPGRPTRYLLEQLGLDARRDGDDAIGDARHRAFGAKKEPRFGRAEISVQHVPVIRVHHTGAIAASGGAVVNRRGQPAKRAGLGHVGVDDLRPEVAHHIEQLRQRHAVVRGRERTAQRRQVFHVDSRRQQIPHVAFAGIELSVHQHGLESARRQAIGQRHRLDRGSADVQSRNHANDAHRGNFITRNFAHLSARL